MKEQHFAIPELEGVLVSEGPGSYTGLRIGASAVKGLLFQTDTPLYAVNTLAGFAQSAINQKVESSTVHAVIDARREHLYHQAFEVADNKLQEKSMVEVKPIQDLQNNIKPGDAIIGTGISRIDKSQLQGVTVFGPGKITAISLIALFEKTGTSFIRQVDPESYDPKYYTSRQVEK